MSKKMDKNMQAALHGVQLPEADMITAVNLKSKFTPELIKLFNKIKGAKDNSEAAMRMKCVLSELEHAGAEDSVQVSFWKHIRVLLKEKLAMETDEVREAFDNACDPDFEG